MRKTSLKRKRPSYPSAKQLEERRLWAEGFDFCFVCRRTAWELQRVGFIPLQTHEIGSRAIAPNKWADVRNYVRTCEECHREVLSWLDEAMQLSLKLLHNRADYDRVFVNRIRGRADGAIDQYEVELWAKFIRAIRGW